MITTWSWWTIVCFSTWKVDRHSQSSAYCILRMHNQETNAGEQHSMHPLLHAAVHPCLRPACLRLTLSSIQLIIRKPVWQRLRKDIANPCHKFVLLNNVESITKYLNLICICFPATEKLAEISRKCALVFYLFKEPSFWSVYLVVLSHLLN